MSDNPHLRGRQDRQTVSSQPYEIGYAISKLAQANPNVPRETVAKAIFAARDAIAPSEGRYKLMAAAQKNIDSRR
ncbi:MAG TPA: hypothetical protein VHD62_06270 [Opitutaceae bacterium]|nr:hypothetical protein [Opitutaceae bacterium]